ncbi:hypothetical protein D3C71_1760120 [compost metagenome]
MAGHVVLHFLDALVVVRRHFEVEALQAQRGLPGVGFDHKDRQAGLERTFTQLSDWLVDSVAAGQQHCADFHAVHRGQTGRNQHVRTVCRGDQQ